MEFGVEDCVLIKLISLGVRKESAMRGIEADELGLVGNLRSGLVSPRFSGETGYCSLQMTT